MKKLMIAVLALLIAVCTVSCNVIITNPQTTSDNTSDSSDAEDDTSEATQTEYAHSNMELAPLDDIIATAEGLNVAVSTFKYFFMDEYSSFISNYYYYLSYYNFDESIPLHDQSYDFGSEPMSWYEFFLERGKSNFEQYAKFVVMAIKEGMTLDDEDNAKIEDNLKSIDDIAKEYSQTFEEYMSQFMGEGMTRERVKTALELSQLGYKYYLKLYNKPQYTDDDIEAEYVNSNGKYSLVDYYEVQIKAVYDETDTDDQAAAAKDEAKTKAEKMKELIDGGMSFTDAYRSAAASDGEDAETETENADDKKDEYLYTGMEYSSLDRYKFLYKENTAEGQVDITYDDAGNASVVQCVKLPYKNAQTTVNVRHILLSSSDYSTEDEAYAAGQKLLQQINEAEDPKAEFIKLVPEYSSDPGSKSNGGLYENVIPGAMVTEFNDWCFDSERKVGDTGLVLTDYGYHIMYLDGRGEALWYYNCEAGLREEAFEKAADEIYETVQITYNEDLLDRITK